MDQNGFYAVMSAINFTLLGLWWNAVKDRRNAVDETDSSRLTVYLVSLQFVIPGTASLLAQVAPEVVLVWRSAFAIAGIIGAVGVVLLARELRRTSGASVVPRLFEVFGVPINIAFMAVALFPLPGDVKPIQVEAFLMSLMVFLGVQEAWVVSMTPQPKDRIRT